MFARTLGLVVAELGDLLLVVADFLFGHAEGPLASDGVGDGLADLLGDLVAGGVPAQRAHVGRQDADRLRVDPLLDDLELAGLLGRDLRLEAIHGRGFLVRLGG
jgi:hypothetical protein